MSFTPRTTAPSASDLRWIQQASGGYNQCIYGSDGPPSVLPDCTGYVHGRVMEIRGVNTDDSGLSFGNGNTYWTASSAAWIRESEPSLGAVVCYDTPTYGHVGIVEEILNANTVIITESHYGGVRWSRVTCYRQYGWRPSAGWNTTLQGFLKNPYVDEPPAPTGLTPVMLLLIKKLIDKRRAANVRIRRL